MGCLFGCSTKITALEAEIDRQRQLIIELFSAKNVSLPQLARQTVAPKEKDGKKPPPDPRERDEYAGRNPLGWFEWPEESL